MQLHVSIKGPGLQSRILLYSVWPSLAMPLHIQFEQFKNYHTDAVQSGVLDCQ